MRSADNIAGELRQGASPNRPIMDGSRGFGGEMGAVIRSRDWTATPLGPRERWPQSLKTAVSLILDSQHPMWIGWGPEMTFLYNDAYLHVLGSAKHPWALGRPAAEVWAEIWDVCGPLADKVFREGAASFADDVRLFMNRGDFLEETYYSFSYSPIRDESGNVAGLFCPSNDVTPKVLNARRLRTLSELATNALIEKATDKACASAMRTLGKNPDDVPFALLYLAEADGMYAVLEQSAGLTDSAESLKPPRVELSRDSNDRVWPVAEVFRTSRFQQISVRELKSIPRGAAGRPVEDAVVLPVASAGQDRPLGVLIAGINPTRKLDAEYRTFFELIAGQVATAIQSAQAAEQEKTRADRLAEIDRAKTVFFSNVSHEFRTPLTLMLSPVEEILSKGGARPADEIRELLKLVHRNGLRLQKLVNTLLDFSRIEAGRVQASYVPTELASFTADLASNFRPACEQAGLKLIVECNPLPEPVYVDRDMWEKIVLNLVSNAFKYTLEGEIRVAQRAEQGRAVLTVTDTGLGIPEKELPRIFERFHRVEGASGRTQEGTGIGLALIHDLVGLHGGSVKVASVLGKGSTFTVEIPLGSAHLPVPMLAHASETASPSSSVLPFVEGALRSLPEIARTAVRSDSEPAPTANTEAHANTSPRRRILIVDDNADMRDYLVRILHDSYQVAAASDGRQALAAVADSKPDLIVSDVMMPHLDGFGLLSALRADPHTVNLPVILLSARAGEESRGEGMEAGADDYLLKPFSARELLARIAAHLKLAETRQRAEQQASRILESITDGFIALDRDWRVTYVNSQAEQLNGMARESLLGRDHWEIFPEAIGTTVDREFHRAVAERVPVEFENYYAPWSRWFHLKAYPTAEGGLSAFFEDITEGKQAALLDEEQKRFLEMIVSGSPLEKSLAALTESVGRLQEGLRACVLMAGAERDAARKFFRAHCSGSFGIARESAIHTGTPESCTDIAASQQWSQSWKEICSNSGILACHVTPILGEAGRTVAYLVLCLPERREPTQWEQRIADFGAHAASIVIERDRTEQALRESEARFRTAVATVTGLIWTNNARGEMEGEQPGWEAFTGQSYEEYQGYGWSKVVHPEDAEATIYAWNQAVARQTMFVFEHRLRRHDGVWRQFSIRALPRLDRDGQVCEWVGVHTDITEERQLMRALRQSEARFRELAESMPQVVWTATPEGVCDYINSQWTELTGCDLQDTQAGVYRREMLSEDVAALELGSSSGIAAGEPYSVECRFRRSSDRALRWYLVRAVPVRSAAGKIVKWFGTSTDIHDQKMTEERLRQANSDLEQFAYSASHDLQEPLRNVAVYSQLLRKRYSDRLDADGGHFLGYITEGAQRMSSLVSDLLAYTQAAQPDTGKLKLVDSERVLQAVLKDLERTIEATGACVTHSKLPSVPMKEVHLQQLLQNLVANAIKYKKDTAAPRIEVSAVREDAHWRFSVRDDGIGIEPQYHSQIFGLFKRLHGRDGKYEGTGIGLAICQKIVERYGGRIWLTSALGAGTTFYFTLPA